MRFTLSVLTTALLSLALTSASPAPAPAAAPLGLVAGSENLVARTAEHSLEARTFLWGNDPLCTNWWWLNLCGLKVCIVIVL